MPEVTRQSDHLRGGERRVGLAVACAVVGILALVTAACSSDGPDTSAAADAAETTEVVGPGRGPAVGSTGCSVDTAEGAGEEVEPGASEEELDGAGPTRTFRRFVPSAYEPTVPAPLVVDLHGLTMTNDLEAALTGFEELAEDEGFVVVTPQGLGDIPFWNFISSGVATDDVAFLGDLVEQVGVDLCIDASRVYASGISNGGLMSSALACRRPDVFAAVAPVAGVAFLPGCEEGPPVGYQAVYGTADDVLPYDGGLGGNLQGFLAENPLDESRASTDEQQGQISTIAFAPVDDTLARWAERNGCESEPVEERVSGEVVRWWWPDCDEGAEVVLYIVEGGGHTWPGTPLLTDRATAADPEGEADTAAGGLASVAGRTTDDISATALAWEFFQRHQLNP
ncbi:MAG TPA: PHB depolymerase family esterase [Acidimicrobiales bacterium]|nr:PHB depolymerase family esterase [Acidimicrobiales bacterium]